MRQLKVETLDYLNSRKSYEKNFWPFELDTKESWAYATDVFTPEQCKSIIELGKNSILRDATVGEGNKGLVKKDIRTSRTSWIAPNDGTAWIFQRLTDISLNINSQFFNFELTGFMEGLQFTEYTEPGGKYNYHVDTMYKGRVRKLSIVVQLTDENTYEGGDLVINVGNETSLPRKQGTFIAFPSYMLHAVKPVTKGTRYSLVAWISGPNFK